MMDSSQDEMKSSDESCDGVCSSCKKKEGCTDPRASQSETIDRMARIKHKIVVGSAVSIKLK